MLVIHISGASGSGKTTMGNELKKHFKNKIIVEDLDNLRDEFIKHYYGNKKWTYINEDEYQNYIDIDDTVIVQQKCIRLLNDIQNDEMALADLVHNNKKFVEKFTEAIKRECSAKETIKMNNKWKRDYERQGYRLMNRENIYKSVVKILNDAFSK